MVIAKNLAQIVLFVTVLSTVPGCSDLKPEAERTAAPELQGAWTSVSTRIGGKAARLGWTDGFTFDGHSVILDGAQGLVKATYSVDPSAEPKQIDLTTGEQIWRGIYNIVKDELTICLGPQEGDLVLDASGNRVSATEDGSHRPTTFDSQRAIVIRFKRTSTLAIAANAQGDAPEHLKTFRATVNYAGVELSDHLPNSLMVRLKDVPEIFIIPAELAYKQGLVHTPRIATNRLGALWAIDARLEQQWIGTEVEVTCSHQEFESRKYCVARTLELIKKP